MLAAALPPGLSPEVGTVAMSTLGGAVAVAGQLPVEVGSAMVDAARTAFLRGLVLCAGISGAGALALAVFAAITFRGIGTAPQQTGEHQVGAVA
jgi:DHA2 family multidrug resistance protein-like MFS transporter